jgi:hypothetical protein
MRAVLRHGMAVHVYFDSGWPCVRVQHEEAGSGQDIGRIDRRYHKGRTALVHFRLQISQLYSSSLILRE